MSDQVIAEIARRLVVAMNARARTRLPEDLKVLLAVQTELARAVSEEVSNPGHK